MRGLFERHIALTGKVMDLQLERQNIVTGNLANINTPNYKARRLEFEEKLQNALDQNSLGRLTRTNPEHMPLKFDPNGFSGDFLKGFKAREIYGQDSVDLDTEVAASAKNTMVYNALATVLKKNFSGISKVIQEGEK